MRPMTNTRKAIMNDLREKIRERIPIFVNDPTNPKIKNDYSQQGTTNIISISVL